MPKCDDNWMTIFTHISNWSPVQHSWVCCVRSHAFSCIQNFSNNFQDKCTTKSETHVAKFPLYSMHILNHIMFLAALKCISTTHIVLLIHIQVASLPGPNYDVFQCCTIDNRGGRRDWICLYVYAEDACHSHVTIRSLWIAQFCYTVKAAFVAFEKDFVHCSLWERFYAL